MTKIQKSLFIGLAAIISAIYSNAAFARCDYPDDLDSAGRRCGGRAASVIPGGRLGGNGEYTDSQGRDRQYGKDNDSYDQPSPSNGYDTPKENRGSGY